MELAPGIRAVGELEVIAHIKLDLPLIDTRLEHFHEASTIPGARSLPHHEIPARFDDLELRPPHGLFLQRTAMRSDAGRDPLPARVWLPGGLDPLLPGRNARLDHPRSADRAARCPGSLTLAAHAAAETGQGSDQLDGDAAGDPVRARDRRGRRHRRRGRRDPRAAGPGLRARPGRSARPQPLR